jgi:DNA modification methylase
VIGGNAVYEQALKLGIPVREVETSGDELIVVRRVDLATDDPKRKALALADNQIATLAEWEQERLDELLAEVGDIDFGTMGFEVPKEPEAPGTAEALVDQAAALLEKWGVERGHVWEIPGKAGVHRVMCGDSTDAGDVALLLAGAEPYLMVTDPPYGVEYDPNWRNEAAAAGKLSYRSARRTGVVTNDDRADWGEVFSSWPCKVLYSWSAGGDHIILTGKAIQDAGFDIRNQIIWSKSNFPISRGAYTYRHEPCWYAVRNGEKAQWIGPKNECTVWEINLDKNVDGGHSTQKPVECMARPIRNHEGDVADPFLGSGTTVIAAELHKRSCWGMEIEPKYVAVTLERCQKAGMEPVRVDG